MDIEKKYSYCGEYKVVKTLGKGAFGKVKLCQKDDNYYAIKMYSQTLCEQQAIKGLTNEVKILSELQHENLVQLIDYNPSMIYQKKNGELQKRVCLILEYAAGGELFEYLVKTGRFKEEIARFYFKQLLQGLIYLTMKGIAHRDLKPENLLFDQNFNLKITDFGFATLIGGRNGTGTLETKLGTKGYIAPEILACQPYSGQSVDIFSSGVVLFILVTGSPPFKEAIPRDATYRLICTNKHEEFWQKQSAQLDLKFCQEFKSLINSMIAFDPTQRISLSELMSHPWLNGNIMKYQLIQTELINRSRKVNTALLKEKLQKQTFKQQNNIRPSLFVGYGNFRSDENRSYMYEENNQPRILKIIQESDSLQLLDIEPDDLYQYLITCSENFCTEIIQSNNQFKFQVKSNINEDLVILTVEIKKIQDKGLTIKFIKLSGNHIQYFKILEKFNQSINQIVQ